MNTSPHTLERWSFLWSQARLLIAAVALFLGGVPPIFLILPGAPLVGWGLKLCWLISGAASLYLLYRWNSHHGRRLFGMHRSGDFWAFLVMCVSGLNLGLAGILGVNLGMTISMNRTVFAVVGILYLICAVYLYRRSQSHGGKLFS